MITTIIIPVLNRYDLLWRCVESIPERVANILVIDNGDALDEALGGRVRVLRMPSNLGVPVSWNLGIKAYPYEPGWLLLNSDAYFADDAFVRFERDCGEDRITLAGAPPWCCAWIGRGVVDRVGLFCEAYYPAYMEDVDYEERARRHGVVIAASTANVQHDNSSTIRSDGALRARNDQTHAANLRTHAHRWRGVPANQTPPATEWSLACRTQNAWD